MTTTTVSHRNEPARVRRVTTAIGGGLAAVAIAAGSVMGIRALTADEQSAFQPDRVQAYPETVAGEPLADAWDRYVQAWGLGGADPVYPASVAGIPLADAWDRYLQAWGIDPATRP